MLDVLGEVWVYTEVTISDNYSKARLAKWDRELTGWSAVLRRFLVKLRLDQKRKNAQERIRLWRCSINCSTLIPRFFAIYNWFYFPTCNSNIHGKEREGGLKIKRKNGIPLGDPPKHAWTLMGRWNGNTTGFHPQDCISLRVQLDIMRY